MQSTSDLAPATLGSARPAVLQSPPRGVAEAIAPGSGGPAHPTPKVRRFVRRVFGVLTFDVPIRLKLVVFCTGVGVWLSLLGAFAAVTTESAFNRSVILGLTAFSILPLVGFATLLSRAMTRPLEALSGQVESLADRYAGQTEDDGRVIHRVDLIPNDEVGALSKNFNRLFEVLQDISSFKKVIEEDDTTEEVYERLGRQFSSMGLPEFVIYEASNSKNRLTPVVTSSALAAESCSPDIQLNCELCRAKKTGTVVVSTAFPDICRQFQPADREHVCVPMNVGGSIGGVVQFLFEKSHGHDDPKMKEARKKVWRGRRFLVESLPVIEAKRLTSSLRQSTLRDPMTGLHNRRFLEEYAETLVASAERRQSPVGLIMCDLDFFKEVNDTHGHDVGDMILKETASIIKGAVRGADIAIRYGGEEFLIVLQETNAEGPMLVAERIRAAVEAAQFKSARGVIRKTISMGISELGTHTSNFWQAVKFADVALYRAKESGRNRATRFEADMWKQQEY